MCPAYVAGLLDAGDRKSVQPMAARDEQVGYDQLIGLSVDAAVWDVTVFTKNRERLLEAKPTFTVVGEPCA
jgi:hypothetical protein